MPHPWGNWRCSWWICSWILHKAAELNFQRFQPRQLKSSVRPGIAMPMIAADVNVYGSSRPCCPGKKFKICATNECRPYTKPRQSSAFPNPKQPQSYARIPKGKPVWETTEKQQPVGGGVRGVRTNPLWRSITQTVLIFSFKQIVEEWKTNLNFSIVNDNISNSMECRMTGIFSGNNSIAHVLLTWYINTYIPAKYTKRFTLDVCCKGISG